MLEKLRGMSLAYSKLKPLEYTGSVNIKIGDRGYQLMMRDTSVEVNEGLNQHPLFTIQMNEQTYEKLVDGTWNGLTAGGKAKMSEKAPVDFIFSDKSEASDLLQIAYHLGSHFFSGKYPSTTRFGPNHTRVIHGGNAAVLAYGHGVRSAYYCIKGDEQINSDERDPWWQCFSVIGGKGEAHIDGERVTLQRGVAVHVPPNVTHTFKADEDELLELIWIAYGDKA